MIHITLTEVMTFKVKISVLIIIQITKTNLIPKIECNKTYTHHKGITKVVKIF